MDISIVGKNSIKLKGKNTAFIVDPSREMPKTEAHAIILLNGTDNIDMGRVTDSKLIISGAGEYEVNGAKISGTTTPKGTLYRLSIDDVSIIIGRMTELKTEGFNTCEIAIANTDRDFNESFVATLEPKIAVLYGDKKIEAAKTLGLEMQNMTLAPKITTTKDKLPEKMKVVVLGQSSYGKS